MLSPRAPNYQPCFVLPASNRYEMTFLGNYQPDAHARLFSVKLSSFMKLVLKIATYARLFCEPNCKLYGKLFVIRFFRRTDQLGARKARFSRFL